MYVSPGISRDSPLYDVYNDVPASPGTPGFPGIPSAPGTPGSPCGPVGPAGPVKQTDYSQSHGYYQYRTININNGNDP